MFYLQVMDKFAASFVFSAVEDVSALCVRGAISVAPGRKERVRADEFKGWKLDSKGSFCGK